VHIFYCAGGNFGEVAGVFLSRKHSPDALRGGTRRCPLASGVLSGAAECTGRTRESPVLSVRCEGVLLPSLRMSPVSTGRSGCVRWLASGDRASLWSSLRTGPVCTGRVRYGLVERPVVLCRRACAVAVGGNSRLQTASDTWRLAEHRTLGVERPVALCERPVPTCFAQ